MASSTIFETGRNSDDKPTVTIHLHASGDNEDTLTNEFVFASEKGFLGPSSNPTDQSGFANKENTVFGVSYEPVTKACFVKLFLLNESGTLVFVNNVNTRAANLLPARWAANAREFLRIESIVGRRVDLQTVDFSTGAEPTHDFSVLVAPDKNENSLPDDDRYDWLKKTLNDFVNVLRPRLRKWCEQQR